MKYIQNNQDLVNWMKVMRMSQGFFFISAMPVLLGAALLYMHHGKFNLLFTILILIGCLLFHLGADMINEYYDHISGNDALVDIHTPFSGGTRVLEEGKLAPKRVLHMSYLFFFLGTMGSAVIAYFTRIEVIIFAFAGLISCWGYSAPPLKFAHRGLGEIIIFLNNGLFIISAIYLAIHGQLEWEIILPSAFLGFLGFAIILMNEVPDINADRPVGKNNLIVRLGVKKGIILQRIMIVCSFTCLITAIILAHIPYWGLLALIFPLSLLIKGRFTLPPSEDLQNPNRLTELCKDTIKLKFNSWILLMIGFGCFFLFEK
jgi:1,4-dihydroxy-2-naphthoate polyprenyltransferase